MRPARGATFTASGSFSAGIFQSTRPVRGATRLQRGEITGDQAFQSTRPVRGATNPAFRRRLNQLFQSTRPVRGATFDAEAMEELGVISIHAPRAGRDAHRTAPRPRRRDFNPRAPCGARLAPAAAGVIDQRGISIHAPRAGRDRPPFWYHAARLPFQSTRPVRGATAFV